MGKIAVSAVDSTMLEVGSQGIPPTSKFGALNKEDFPIFARALWKRPAVRVMRTTGLSAIYALL